jgi:hypothetical protein
MLTNRPYFNAWLSRTRRQFAVSGRLSQTALVLSQEEGGNQDDWCARLRNLLEGGETPSLELLTRIDAILSGNRAEKSTAETQSLFW